MSKGVLRSSFRALKDTLPLQYPVRLRVRPLKDCYGTASLVHHKSGEKSFLIEIDSKLEGPLVLWVLVHEYAHCRAWGAGDEDHGPLWGCAYAEVYRELFPD